MDEVEFAQAYNRLRKVIDSVQSSDPIVFDHIRNSLLIIAAMLDGLNQRMVETQIEEDC